MKALLIAHTHVCCPHCGEEAGRVDHLFDDREWREAGPWYCESCGDAYKVRVNSPTDIEVEPVAGHKIDTFVLLKIEPQEKPVFFVVKGLQIGTREEGHERYYYEEHSCPTNYVRCEAIISESDSDPHGIFSFVRSIPIPEENEPDQEDWALFFPEAFA